MCIMVYIMLKNNYICYETVKIIEFHTGIYMYTQIHRNIIHIYVIRQKRIVPLEKMGRSENMTSKSLLVLTDLSTQSNQHIETLQNKTNSNEGPRSIQSQRRDPLFGLLIPKRFIESERKRSKIKKIWSRRYCSNPSLYGTKRKIPFFKAGIVHCYIIVDISQSSDVCVAEFLSAMKVEPG